MMRLDEKVYRSLDILTRRGGNLLKAERVLIAETLKDLAVLANGEPEREALRQFARVHGNVA